MCICMFQLHLPLPQDASGEVASSPPVRVELAAAAVAAALLQTIPPALQAAVRLQPGATDPAA